jgi:hypothetical protein
MYKVFVNDKPLFLTNKISKKQISIISIESIDIKQLIVKYFKIKFKKTYHHPDEEIMKTLKTKNLQRRRRLGLQ